MLAETNRESNEAHPSAHRGADEPPIPVDEQTPRQRLGPVVVMARLERPIAGRLYAAGMTAAAVALLITAASVSPDCQGMGTHRQLTVTPHACAFVTMTGLPCPTCGMTTAFAYTVRGQVGSALRAQAAGCVLALMTAAGALVGLTALVAGRFPTLNWYRVKPLGLLWWGLGLLLAAWAVKIFLGLLDGSLPVR